MSRHSLHLPRISRPACKRGTFNCGNLAFRAGLLAFDYNDCWRNCVVVRVPKSSESGQRHLLLSIVVALELKVNWNLNWKFRLGIILLIKACSGDPNWTWPFSSIKLIPRSCFMVLPCSLRLIVGALIGNGKRSTSDKR